MTKQSTTACPQETSQQYSALGKKIIPVLQASALNPEDIELSSDLKGTMKPSEILVSAG